MVHEDAVRGMPPDDPAAWTRAVRLGRAATRRIVDLTRGLFLAGGVALCVGAFAHGAGADALLANAAGIAMAVVLVGLASLPLHDHGLRAALELVGNHQVREAAEWKRETGTRMPRGRQAIRDWLEMHPDRPGRGTLLTVIGRFAEAGAHWDRHPGQTPGEVFGVEVQRETAWLLAGSPPDLERLRRLWKAMPISTEQRERRECLAVLEAEVGALSGADPIAILAAARADIGPITRRARISTLVAAPLVAVIATLAVLTYLRLWVFA